MSNIRDDLADLGYDVTLCEPNCYRIEGLGVRTYVPHDDRETLESFSDPVLHALRLAAMELGRE